MMDEMRKAKPLKQSLDDYRSGRINIPPANLVVLGYTKPIPEPLLLEALANHPGIGKIWYVPIDGESESAKHNFDACKEDFNQFFRDYTFGHGAYKFVVYCAGIHVPVPSGIQLEAFNIAPLLKRHGGPQLNHTRIVKTLEEYFANDQSEPFDASDSNILINGSNLLKASGFITRRREGLVSENHPLKALVSDDKTSIPSIGQEVAQQGGPKVTADCANVKTLKELRAFMNSIDADQLALKTPYGIAGIGVFRVFRETRNGPLMAECTNQKSGFSYGADDNGSPQIFSLTDAFFEEEGTMLAMRWLDNSKGDIRVVIQDGHAVGAYKRMPAANNWLCNYGQGGSIHPVDMKRDLTLTDRLKVKKIAEYLKDNEIHRASIDLLADSSGERWLSEINIGCTDDVVELDAHDLGKQAKFGRLSIPEQMAADVMARYGDISAERAVRRNQHREQIERV